MSDPRTCPSCGAAVVSATARFCAEYGTSLDEGRRQRAEVSQIVAHRAATGVRKFVTVLFADIQGSTTVAAGLDPEDWYLALEQFHGAATASIHEFDGVVTLYAGDGVMALFGAPIADENHALAACHAALRLVERFETMAQRVEASIGTRLRIRVGLNSGEVVVGKIGQGVRVDYTAQGMPVHIAARMEQIAEGGQVFVAPATAALVATTAHLEEVGTRDVKGAPEPVLVRRLIAMTEPRERADQGTFVGRERELGVLRAAFDDAARGHGRTVAVVGAAGHGKSRLVSEYLRELARSGATTVHVKAEAVRVPRPFWAIGELITHVLGLARDVDESALALTLAKVAPSLAAHAPTFDAAIHPGRHAALDPDVVQRRMNVALRALVDAATATRDDPLVVAVDDVHALDRRSVESFGALAADRPDGGLVLIFSGRPGTVTEELVDTADVVLDLQALDPVATTALMADHLDHPEAVDRLAGVLHERTGGNPFFLEETLRSLHEEGVLVGPPGSARLVGDLDNVSLPPTVQTVVAARIDRLAHDDRDLLHVAAVLGLEFEDDVLREVAGVDVVDLQARLRRLVDARLLVAGDGRCRFHHRTTQEVAYDTQLRDRRERVHGDAAVVLSERSDARVRAVEIGDHFDRAGRNHEAAAWYEIAAVAAASHDPAESKRLWGLVRTLSTGDDDVSIVRSLTARAEILGQGVRVGISSDEIHRTLAESREIAVRAGQDTMLVLVLLRGWYALNGAGLTAEARATSREAIELADASGIALMSVGARLAEVSNYSAARPAPEGLALCREIESLLVENGLDHPDSIFKGQLDFCRGSLLVREGKVDESLALLESAVEVTDRVSDNLWRVVSRVGLVVAMAAARAPGGLRAVAEEARSIADEVGGTSEVTMATRSVGLAALADGNPTEAIVHLEEALEASRAAGTLSTEEMMMAALSEAYRLGGRPDRAAAIAAEAIELTTARENENYELMAQLALAAAALDVDPGDPRIPTSLGRAADIIDANGVHLYDGELAHLQRRFEETR